jgi:hypothetical protein
MHDLGVFQGHVVAGDFQHGELSSLIIRAEALQRLLRNGPECFVTADWFSILAYSVVRDLVNWAFAHPGQFTTDDLAFITRIAVRSGVLGAGAQDQDYAQQTEDTLKGAFDARLTQAIANGDRGEVLEIMELAVEMHWTDQAARASQWLAGG